MLLTSLLLSSPNLHTYLLEPVPASDTRPAIYAPNEAAMAVREGMMVVGTGGIVSPTFFANVQVGYLPRIHKERPAPPHYSVIVERIKESFGRNTVHLASAIGVSRQAFYNWLAGEEPRAEYKLVLDRLALAAEVFCRARFTPSAQDLRRPVMGGRSLLAVAKAGGDVERAAQALLRISARSERERQQLDRLAKRLPKRVLSSEEFSKPLLDEKS